MWGWKVNGDGGEGGFVPCTCPHAEGAFGLRTCLLDGRPLVRWGPRNANSQVQCWGVSKEGCRCITWAKHLGIILGCPWPAGPVARCCSEDRIFVHANICRSSGDSS